ncbi:hypothetical protein FHY55_10960 [Oceanicola sp. D3]|uniref:hypothetical protein n=1 Tax=Oceanicola sp. D3 TaxID=2587163 RepID=UPI0011222299|nr:hypothetical protein [Oceanicola sp. D3]QDC09734.1 hypothetical protein FHY55_10960 [Oceanicola sp. D3]
MTRWTPVLTVVAALAVVHVPAPVEAQGGGFLNQFKRDLREARRDMRRKMGVDIRVERKRAPQQAAAAPRGPVIRRETGLVATSIRPEGRPGAEIAQESGPSAAEVRQEALLAEAVEAGDLAPEIAQVIRAGSFPTMEELEGRAAGLGNGWLPGGAEMALRGTEVICEDGGEGGCAAVAGDPALADVRGEAEVIEAQAEAVRSVAALPRLAAAMAEVRRERASAEANAADTAREYPVARGEELPPIDSLLDAQGN